MYLYIYIYISIEKTPGMRVLADAMPPSLSRTLAKGNEYLSLPVLKLGEGVFCGSAPLSCLPPLTQGGSPRAPGLFGSLTAGSPCCTQDT